MNLNIPKRPKRQINGAIEGVDTLPQAAARVPASTGIIDDKITPVWENEEIEGVEDEDTARVDSLEQQQLEPSTQPLEMAPPPVNEPKVVISRGKALIGIFLLAILVFNAILVGNAGFIGPQGWAFVLNGPTNS